MTIVALMSLSSLATAQTADKDLRLEAEIRRLDQDAARAIQHKDEAAIRRFFTPDSVTNNPRNGLTKGSAGVIEAARANVIDYHSFERNIESVQLLGDTAVVMGNEIVVVRGPGRQARIDRPTKVHKYLDEAPETMGDRRTTREYRLCELGLNRRRISYGLRG